MLFNSILHALPATLLVAGISCSPLEHQKRQLSIDDFVKSQADVSINGVLANIGSDGSKAQGAAAGIVVASPSRTNPDYWYTWIRDSALTYKALIERLAAGDISLRQKIDDYVSAQAYLQNLSNPSGDPSSGGLGEPKFNVDKTSFIGSWGRPQRDGPPLRATALVLYANWLLANGGQEQALNTVWPVITKDIAYTVRYWNSTGFDLWEEINGSSFFTLAASHRALVESGALATKLGQSCENCAESASQVLCFLQSFWTGSYIDSNINVNDGRTGKDANSLISAIHTFDPAANCTDATLQPCSARALANHKAVTDSFRAVYNLNVNIPIGQAVAVGRYAEDVYYNGNPWYLATLAAAEQLYAALHQWEALGFITIDAVSLPFFTDLIFNIQTGTYAKSSTQYNALAAAVRTYADGFLAIVQRYTPASGALAEQFDRNSGAPLSAADLTWSYAAFLTAVSRRAGVVGESWGETGANQVPGVCTAPTPCTATISVSVRATTTVGETIVLVGSVSELGSWDPAKGVTLSADEYTAENPVWKASVVVGAGGAVEYKYVKRTEGGGISWESDPNRRVTVPGECGGLGAVEDSWR